MPTLGESLTVVDVTAATSAGITTGSRIRRARQVLGLTQTELAASIEAHARAEGRPLTLTGKSVGHWETGRNRPSVRIAPHVAAVLDLDVVDLTESEAP